MMRTGIRALFNPHVVRNIVDCYELFSPSLPGSAVAEQNHSRSTAVGELGSCIISLRQRKDTTYFCRVQALSHRHSLALQLESLWPVVKAISRYESVSAFTSSCHGWTD
jgi:hypothetical protein